jgi:hypothetical protein
MNDTNVKTRRVNYIDPHTGKRVEKVVEIPPPAKVKTLSCGASVEEIPNLEALAALWTRSTRLGELVTPLAAASRQVLAEELKQALTEDGDHEAIDALSSTWQPTDDIVLKVLGRLSSGIARQREKRAKNVNKAVQLKHERDCLADRVARYETENKTLHTDITKIVNERDALKRRIGNVPRAENEARDARKAMRQAEDDHRCTQVRLEQTETALTGALNEGATVKNERDALLRDAQRNLEIALNEYEGEVVGKLASVAEDHNEKAKEVNRLQEEVSRLKGARNVLQSQVDDHQKNQLQRAKNNIAKVNKEREMSENETTTETTGEQATLRCGDEVYTKVAGEGPFVLMTQVEEAQVEYTNPIANKRNSFSCGKLPVYNAWLTRCKDGTYRTFPAPALTTERPKSTLSFNGVKSMVTSDVTSKMFQAAIWISMLTLLFMRG